MPGLVFTLAETTPNRLRYLIEDDGTATGFPSSGTIANATLQDDAIDGSQMADLVATAVADQAAARKLLAGEGLTTQADIDTPRAHLKITARNNAAAQEPWAVDANVAANLAVIDVYGSDTVNTYAYLDVEFEHTLTR